MNLSNFFILYRHFYGGKSYLIHLIKLLKKSAYKADNFDKYLSCLIVFIFSRTRYPDMSFKKFLEVFIHMKVFLLSLKI
jgi:hypothetical protein